MYFLHTDESFWKQTKREGEYFTLTSQFLSWGFELATSPQQNKSRYEITLWAYKSGVLICFRWKRLLLLSHYLSFQAHTTAAAITATMAFSEELRIVIYFSFITFQIEATLSLRPSICLMSACVCVALADRLVYYLWVSFSIEWL